MTSILAFTQQTPWWVFTMLALLTVLGIQALKDRTLPLWRLLIVPAVFIGWGLASLLLQPGAPALLVADWIACALTGGAAGLATGRSQRFHVEPSGAVAVKGSAFPLMRNLAIFIAKYGLTAAAAVQPMQREALAPWSIAVSGLAAGYFLGGLVPLLRAYRKSRAGVAPQPVLEA
jgi:hypothetical protein